MGRPRLLDLCSGAGGCAAGYARAGFDVDCVDIEEQPDNPFPFALGDALTWPLDGYDVVHLSAPCQRFSSITPEWARHRWPDLVTPMRERLRKAVVDGVITGYVMENVVGSPLRSPVQVCGSAFGLGVQRHRLFESSWQLAGTGCAHSGDYVRVYGSEPSQGVPAAREAMGVDWMPWSRLVEAVPPAYTEYLGRQMIRHLGRRGSVTASSVVSSFSSTSFRQFTRAGSVTLDDRDLSPHLRGCRHCGEPVEVAATGRWRRYCSQACRQAAYRVRQA